MVSKSKRFRVVVFFSICTCTCRLHFFNESRVFVVCARLSPLSSAVAAGGYSSSSAAFRFLRGSSLIVEIHVQTHLVAFGGGRMGLVVSVSSRVGQEFRSPVPVSLTSISITHRYRYTYTYLPRVMCSFLLSTRGRRCAV